MLASGASIIYAQNQYLDDRSVIFDRYNTLLVDRIGREDVAKNYETFKEQVLRFPGVINVTASNNVPFEQSSDFNTYARSQGDEAAEVSLLTIMHDHDFMETYQYPVIAGRDFDKNITFDTYMEAVEGEDRQPTVNVILNRMALEALGWDGTEDALGGSFYYSTADSPPIQHQVIGIVNDVNYRGMVNEGRPMIFMVRSAGFQTASISMTNGNHAETIKQVEDLWKELNPNFPIVQRLLDDEFMQVFRVLQGLAGILGGFAIVAVFVAFIGLFGMAAFVTQVRTKELGIRKVLGASVNRLVRFVVIQISIPVLVAIIPASALAWAAMKFGYLKLFPDRIENLFPFIGTASVSVLVIAWIIVSFHAWKVANSNPINALRYE
jgi:putative ABC transport system permease protein